MLRNLTPVLAGILAAASAVALHACGHACTLMGCFDTLTFEFSEPLAEGRWTVQIEAEGATVVCAARVPLGDPADTACSVMDAEWTFASSDGQWIPDGIVLRSAPAEVDVTVLHDGEPVLHERFRPKYAPFNPNGPECPPTCKHTTLELQAPSP
jgi:hypothetical protein